LLVDEAFANSDTSVEPGTMIGEYRVEKKLGERSFGEVYAGVQPLIGKKVAIELLHERMSSEPEIVARFIDEVRAVNGIGHPNIIDVLSFGVHHGSRNYFVMELCEGRTLGAFLLEKTRLTPAEAMPILRGIADGLDAAHQAGVTHRDLRPDNVFLVRERDGSHSPKLLDYGVATLVREEGAQPSAMGTPRYMSPEQCRGNKIDHRSDIYALGCMVHEMLTGKPVFEADATESLIFKHTTEKPSKMSVVCPSIPPELDEPVLAMLAKRPLGRPNSAGAAIDALDEAVCLAVRAGKIPVPTTLAPSVATTMRASANDTRTADDIAEPATRKSLIDLPSPVATEIAFAPPVQSQMPVTLASAPLTTAIVDKTPEVKVVGATVTIPEAFESPPPPSSSSLPRSGRRFWQDLRMQPHYVVAAFVGILLGLAILYFRGRADSKMVTPPKVVPSQTLSVSVPLPVPEPATMTLRVAVVPADARILVDGRDMGGAGHAIALPRDKKQHEVRIERRGYESRMIRVSAEVDKEIGPIVLTALAASPVTSASSDKPVGPTGKPAMTKSRSNKGLWKSEERGK